VRRRPWSPDDLEILKKHCDLETNAELAARLGRTVQAIKTKLNETRFRNGAPEGIATPPPFWSAEESRQLLELYSTLPALEVAKRLHRSTGSIRERLKTIRVQQSKRGLHVRKKFTHPVGHRAWDTHGTMWQKVSLTGPRHQRWRHAHEMIWEEANGPIPDGYVVVFKNNDRSIVALDNLELITLSEKWYRRRHVGEPPEITAISFPLLKLQEAIRKREHEEQD